MKHLIKACLRHSRNWHLGINSSLISHFFLSKSYNAISLLQPRSAFNVGDLYRKNWVEIKSKNQVPMRTMKTEEKKGDRKAKELLGEEKYRYQVCRSRRRSPGTARIRKMIGPRSHYWEWGPQPFAKCTGMLGMRRLNIRFRKENACVSGFSLCSLFLRSR